MERVERCSLFPLLCKNGWNRWNRWNASGFVSKNNDLARQVPFHLGWNAGGTGGTRVRWGAVGCDPPDAKRARGGWGCPFGVSPLRGRRVLDAGALAQGRRREVEGGVRWVALCSPSWPAECRTPTPNRHPRGPGSRASNPHLPGAPANMARARANGEPQRQGPESARLVTLWCFKEKGLRRKSPKPWF